MAKTRIAPTMEKGLQFVLESEKFPEAYKDAMTKNRQMPKETCDSRSARWIIASASILNVPCTI